LTPALANADDPAVSARSRAVVIAVVVVVAAVSAVVLQGRSADVEFRRYAFVQRQARGVLEVDSEPPSICYSTQSLPARPIALVNADGDTLASYSPGRGTFCDRPTSAGLVAVLLEDPGTYRVRWSPLVGEPVVESSLRPMG
jgi:hypothetical protein